MTTTTAAPVRTRRTRISERKVAFQGDAYRAEWIGTRVAYTTYEGDVLVGVLEWPTTSHYPTVRFADGKWARLDTTVDVVVD